MADAQIYCTMDEMLTDLDMPGGDVAALLRHIKSASQTIRQEIGDFIPVTAACRFDGNGKDILFVPALLAVTSIVDDTHTLNATDYLLYPRTKHWENGPYTWLQHDPDGNYSEWSDELDVVVITGRWGLWEKNEASGAVIGTGGQTSGAGTLLADNGSKLSPGMVTLIGSEQELVTGFSTPTTVTTIAEDLDISEEVITVADGTKVNIGEIIRVNFEQCKVLDKQTNDLYVRRGWNNTSKATHTNGANVEAYRTFTVERGANGTTAAAHDASTVIYRYLVPDDVSFLCREVATLMLKKAQGGFAGKTGNSQLGETFYHDAFPRWDLERVAEHYQIKRVY